MAMLTPRAAAAVAAALHTARVPALRARASRGGAPTATDYADTPSVVETGPARRKGPGEAAVTRGAATVYLPAPLLEAYPDLVLELHTVPVRPDRPDRPGPAPPTLRLRPPTTPEHCGAAPASHRERATPEPRRGPRREDAAAHTPVGVNSRPGAIEPLTSGGPPAGLNTSTNPPPPASCQ